MSTMIEPSNGQHVVGPRIRTLRTGQGMSSGDLAKAIGISKSMAGRLETKYELPANHPILPKIADYFHIPVADLIEGSTTPLLSEKNLKHISAVLGGKRLPRKTTGRRAKDKNSPKYKARHEGYILSRKLRGKARGVPAEMLRAIVTTFNASRMKGMEVVPLPMDVLQPILADVLQRRKINPATVLIEKDFSQVFRK